MNYPPNSSNKLTFSICIASAIAQLLYRQRDAVGLCLFSQNIDVLTPIKSTSSHVNYLFKVLAQRMKAKEPQQATTHIASTLHQIAKKVHRRALIILFSDLFDSDENMDGLFNALQHLKHQKHEVLIFHVSDHTTELSFTFGDRPYEFIDMETRSKIKINPGEMRDQFIDQLNRFHRVLRLKCSQLKVDLVVANSQNDYFEVLQAYLIKRAKMN